ncbi:methylated-DNA--protein-cysteine methyltransferase isoform X2 [Gallus gallus]|uniref:methylated-DNA--protein-cysteine methyltransferase isoform X2 n=1 Tax=Gallus gallus TaxID=9031 RepID=UPI001AE910FB|nr:methylated-DNA--protein-cysteine methyltransferase isoform X2 [Gallus gallus]XP_040530383.1 methylated-DNA--protein-cysteine methyltransferase isoform X2 [Gallus gallus]
MFTKRPRRALEQLSADAISARPSSVPPLPIPEHAGGARKASRRGEVVLLGGRQASPSTMASRRVPKMTSKEGTSQCQEKHAVLLSPVGKLEISGCETGVHEIKLPRLSVLPNGTEAAMRCELSGSVTSMPEPLQQCAAWLNAYFCEPSRTEQLPLPPFHHPMLQQDSFTKEVLWTLLREVKFGEAISYQQLAERAGNSRAARAVGGAMRSNPIPIIIPCHRVICSSGQIGNYGGGNVMKEWLLSHEKLQKEKLAD